MPRIQPVQIADTQGRPRQMLEGIQQKMGMVPNLIKTLAKSPAALDGYLGLTGSLSHALTAPLREQVALTVAGTNQCAYCASAHTLLGAKVGLDAEEMVSNMRGESSDEHTQAVLRFAQAVVQKRGMVEDEEIEAVRAAGISDAQIIEIVALVTLNIFTNYINHVAETEVDFPMVDVVPLHS